MAIVNDFEYTHIEVHVLESRRVDIDGLKECDLTGDEVVVNEGDVGNVDEYFGDGDIMGTAQSQLDLHALHQHLVHLDVLFVELFLLVVNAVQQVLNVRNFTHV